MKNIMKSVLKTEANRARGIFVVCSLAGVLLATTVPADVILYSYPQAGEGPGTWQSMEGGLSRLAQTFTTGADALTLNSISIWIRNASEDDFDSQAGSLSLNLYATDGASRPTGSSLLPIVSGMPIEEWYNNPQGPVETTSTRFLGLSYQLSPNTTYAVVFEPSASGTISWRYPNSGAPVSDISPSPTFYNWQWNGSSWANADPSLGFSMNITATAVPEPNVPLVVFALWGLGGLVRRRLFQRKLN